MAVLFLNSYRLESPSVRLSVFSASSCTEDWEDEEEERGRLKPFILRAPVCYALRLCLIFR